MKLTNEQNRMKKTIEAGGGKVRIVKNMGSSGGHSINIWSKGECCDTALALADTLDSNFHLTSEDDGFTLMVCNTSN